MKAKLIALMFGFALLLGVGGLVSAQTVQQTINNGLECGSNLKFPQSTPDASCGNVGQASNSIQDLVHHIVNLLSAVVGVVAVIMIIFGGFRYVTSGGSDSSVTSAKNTILYAIIGLVIVALSQLLVHFTIKNITG